MSPLWLLDFEWPPTETSVTVLAPEAQGQVVGLWRSADRLQGRAYASGRAIADAGTREGATWTALECLQFIAGPAQGAPAACHYVVEADVAPEHDADFNAWYEREHLPGLAGVPGTIHAARYRRMSGAPRYLACYDLLSPDSLSRAEWLSVRHTEWSARIRPLFKNTRRTMFFRPQDMVEAADVTAASFR